jgi:molybdopterin-guanine dinucleotide biosynthesis protein A
VAETASYDAVVLAGGSGRRLGGVDKPALRVGEQSLLDRVLSAVADASVTVVVGPARETSRPVTWVREKPPGGGPVAALAAGLPLVTSSLVAVLAADLPFLDAGTVSQLRGALGDYDGALLVDDDGRDQLLVGVWRTAALRAALPASVAGARLGAVLGGLRAVRLSADVQPAPWFDCDTEADLTTARGSA